MTREEAINKVRQMSLPKETMEILEALAPELVESEDERVIKALETFINQPEIADKITFEARIGWLAWLEKQKESLHVHETCKENADSFTDDIIEVRSFQRGLEEGRRQEQEKQKEPHYTKRNALFDKCVENCDPEVMKEVSDEIDDMLKKKQNPVEPSDDELQRHQDELYNFKVFAAKQAKEHHISFVHDFEWNSFCAEILSYFNEQKPAGFYVTLNGEKYYAEEVRCNGMNVKVVAPKPAEWSEEKFESVDNAFRRGRETGFREGVESVKQSAEWSEEDEKMLNKCIHALEEPRESNSGWPVYISEINFLKSLRPQSREKIYQSAKHDLAIRFMNYLDENRPDGKMGLSNGECEDIDKAFKENDWAKIMRYVEKYRPSWKPSAHQMNILTAVKEYVGRGSGYWGEGLGSLIEDLEKLM